MPPKTAVVNESIGANRLVCLDCAAVSPLVSWKIQDVVCDLGHPHPTRHCPKCGKPQSSPKKA